MLPDCHLTVFTFCSWLDSLVVVLACRILQISQAPENVLETSLGHNLNFWRYLVIFRVKNMFLKESLNPSAMVI